MNRTALITCLSLFLFTLPMGCQQKKADDGKKKIEKAEHMHEDALKWPKKDIKHAGFVISLGHHKDHFHGGDELEPAVALTKDGKDIGDATMTCQLMDGETPIGEAATMVYEPKTEDEPAHYAQGMVKFPEEEKKYQVKFTIFLPDVETPFKDSIDVLSGH